MPDAIVKLYRLATAKEPSPYFLAGFMAFAVIVFAIALLIARA